MDTCDTGGHLVDINGDVQQSSREEGARMTSCLDASPTWPVLWAPIRRVQCCNFQ